MSGTEPLPSWRPLRSSAREREGRSPQVRWLQLATLAPDGTPRVRHLSRVNPLGRFATTKLA
ncbi:MAG: hypothetical protein WCP63_00175, partial [Cyanobium sp. ELA712]